MGDSQLEQAIYDTVRYFSLFKMPVTTVQIWRSLIVEREAKGIRWHGHHVPTLQDIRDTLLESSWLKQKIDSTWGYYYLQSAVTDGQKYVRRRLIKHSLTQQKWKITKKIARLLAPLPFVRMIGGSGSLAMFNTESNSDLDLFIIVKKGRVWTARLCLLMVSQITGRRRKYWDEVAPDKVCLNHYITDKSLLMSTEVRNLYTAQLYTKLVPLAGLDMYKKWMAINQPWIRQWIMYPDTPTLPSRLYLRNKLTKIQKIIEGFLTEFPGDVFEKIAKRAQTWAIEKHSQWHSETSGAPIHNRIIVSNNELAFHPNTRVPEILRQFEEEEGQGQLL